MNDLFDDLKAIKSKMKAEEKKPSAPIKKKVSKEVIMEQKEDELKADFLEYMKDTQVKKI